LDGTEDDALDLRTPVIHRGLREAENAAVNQMQKGSYLLKKPL
jgi:hypothetical protein